MTTRTIWLETPPTFVSPETRLPWTKPGDVLRTVEIDFWRRPWRYEGPMQPQAEFYDPTFGAWWRMVAVYTYFEPPESEMDTEMRDGPLGKVEHETAVRHHRHPAYASKERYVDGGFVGIYRLDLPLEQAQEALDRLAAQQLVKV